jgi:hypothetical protein
MKFPGIPTYRRQATRPGPVPAGPLSHRLAAHTPALAAPFTALGHGGLSCGTAVAVAAALLAGPVLVTVATAVVREWFWWRARTQPARDLRRLLRHTASVHDAERLARHLAARHQAVIDAYVRAHTTSGAARRSSSRPDDVPRRSR